MMLRRKNANVIQGWEVEGNLFKLYLGDRLVMVLPGETGGEAYGLGGIASEAYEELASLADEWGLSSRIENMMTGHIIWQNNGNSIEDGEYDKIDEAVREILSSCSW